jgi:uncharacterized protein YegJ (DUF2314 family)
VLDQIFGSADQVSVLRSDEELEAASRRARGTLLAKVKPAFLAGLPHLEHLLVKAPFPQDDGGNEWMWIEVLAWDGTLVKGILQSDPHFVRGLKAGDRVETSEDDIFDYIHVRADGSRQGNTTAELLLRREQRRIPSQPPAQGAAPWTTGCGPCAGCRGSDRHPPISTGRLSGRPRRRRGGSRTTTSSRCRDDRRPG